MSSTTTQLFQETFGTMYSRRLLLHMETRAAPPTPTASLTGHDTSEGSYPGDTSFDANVVMVLSVLLCALICSLGLNSIIRCALRCSNLVASESNHSDSNPSSAAARLANTGIKKKALKIFPTIQYSEGLNLPGLDTECAICLAEFVPGERLRLLPKCNHGFHVRCIDRWLSSHSSCPTCRHCLIQTCQKIVGGCSTTTSETSQLPRVQQDQTIICITPLQPEGLIRNYQT